jgi:hypothetical protein
VLDAQNRKGEGVAGDTMVQVPKQPGFSHFYVPGTAELVKEVFAEEAAGAITQGLAQEGGYTAFGEWGLDHCLGARRADLGQRVCSPRRQRLLAGFQARDPESCWAIPSGLVVRCPAQCCRPCLTTANSLRTHA